MTLRGMATGRSGEVLAQGYLEQQGLQFIEANWRCATGEIDLVMLDGEILVFVEVKTRSGRQAGAAEESVSAAKSRKLLATGEWYVTQHEEHHDRFWRIDILAISLGTENRVERITHIANAITVG
jgi:putative endonuclease